MILVGTKSDLPDQLEITANDALVQVSGGVGDPDQ